ncbi:hypothetical protein EG68_01123 [Paragonimus skrjabini miyazakii]|uniref:Uncharacterized protein n=1 Tax=Paragonimus skrjabini miyazakii TaxID=59628 RepID=A0A8S9Z7J3_9TREM|nr:hypothetical protein EG68_01123 [Paragonimus skrjabini miyazakii]
MTILIDAMRFYILSNMLNAIVLAVPSSAGKSVFYSGDDQNIGKERTAANILEIELVTWTKQEELVNVGAHSAVTRQKVDYQATR